MTGFLDVERSSNLVISLGIYPWVALFYLKSQISNLKSMLGDRAIGSSACGFISGSLPSI
ncbi:hypothetical protein [Microcoleus sp. M2_D5]|uniref:hypothetical protein n=1 Tax=Microcoleus sp. M2_D5 TaxID=3055376 RepID=UPI002FD1F255